MCLSTPKNNTCRDAFNIKEELQSLKNELVEEFSRLTQEFFEGINSFKSDVVTPDAPITNTTLSHSKKCINHLLDQVSLLRELMKSKNQQINSLLEHSSRCDDNHVSKKGSLLPANAKQTNTAEIRPETNSIYTTNANIKKDP